MQNCPNFEGKFGSYISSNISEVIWKKRERGSDKYENWLVEQFDRAKKKISK